MNKKIVLSLVIFQSATFFLFADEPPAPENKQTPSKITAEDKQDVPDWVKRTNFAIEAGTGQRPKYFLETIQPLLGTQDKDIVFFNQTRISERDSRPTYNTGFGLRKIFDEKILLGLNSFYDFQELHKHSRMGVGFEAMCNRGFEARLNTYIRVSGNHLVKEDSVNEYYEKVANGLDWELGAPLPYLPFLKIFGGGNWYNFGHFRNKYGWQMRLEYTPIKYSRLDFIMHNDNKTEDTDYRFEGAITLAFTSFSLGDILRDIKSATAAFPKIDLHDKVLDRVVRDFDITVIKETKSKVTGLIVEGGRT